MKDRLIPHSVQISPQDRKDLDYLASTAPSPTDPSKLLREAIHTCVTNPAKLADLFAKLLLDETTKD